MTTIFAIICLLLITVVVVALGERIKLPWPALLTIVASGIVFVPGLPALVVPPDLIMPILLPPLLWALARKTSWKIIRRQLSTIVLLSIVLVFITIGVLAGITSLLVPSIGISSAILIAAALAPPDPVAVDAVAEPAHIPRRVTTTLQMEGLFNDAASIVTFNVALTAIAAGRTLSWKAEILTFLWSSVTAIVLGLFVGRVSAWFIQKVPSSAARNAFTWVLPFAVYFLAEEIEASGVIAIVLAAVELSSRSSTTAMDRLSGSSFWSTVEILFTGVAFGLIGISVHDSVQYSGTDIFHALLVGFILSISAMIVRYLWLFFCYRAHVARGRTGVAPLSKREVVLMGWSGMRGLVTLALILSIPAEATIIPHELPLIALSVLLFTMLIPGLLLPWLVSALELSAPANEGAEREKRSALSARIRRAAYTILLQDTDLTPDRMSAIYDWIDSEIHSSDESSTNTAADNRLTQRKKIAALRAAQQELLRARREPGADKQHVDEMLVVVDRLLMQADK